MLLTLFITFFKIGLFTIGGGYAMIPLIEREVVERKGWISREDFLDLLAIALFLGNYRDNRIVENVFKGIRPAVIALILTPTIRLASKAGLNKWTWWVPVVTALAIWWLGVSPVWIIFATILGAILYYILKLRKA